MEIRQLEQLVRTAIRQNPTQPAMATVASIGSLGAEFSAAVASLAGREARSNSLLRAAATWL